MAPVVLAAIAAGTSLYGMNRQMHEQRLTERERRDRAADAQRREDQLANEEKARVASESAAKEKARTLGRRTGWGAMGPGTFSPSLYAMGAGRPMEDNIGRGTLFGN